jgi:hypothetical protein
MLSHVSGLSSFPGKQWQRVHCRECSVSWCCISTVVPVNAGISAVKRFLSRSRAVAGPVAWMCMTVANDLFRGDGFAPHFLV